MTQITDMGNNIFRIGDSKKASLFPNYSYIVISGEKGILIDPGPRENFSSLCSSLITILPVKNISFIILTSEQPDACSSLPLWNKNGFDGKILVHWKAYLSVLYYGWEKKRLATIRSSRAKIRFGNKREIYIFNTPGTPTPGSLSCFDIQSKTLFSGMLFGSFGGNPEDADEESWGRIESFHDQFFSHLKSGKNNHSILASLPINCILSRNGPPIKQLVSQSTSLLTEISNNTYSIEKPDEVYNNIIYTMNQRFKDLFSKEELQNVLRNTEINFTSDFHPDCEGDCPKAVFEHYINEIHRAKGILWLSMVKNLIEEKLEAIDEPLPRIFNIFKDEIEEGIGNLVQEVQKLKTENFELQRSIIEASDDRLKDQITGLYNEVFFEEYIDTLIPPEDDPNLTNESILFIRLDRIIHLNRQYGSKTVDSTIKALANFMLNNKRENAIFFRMNGPLFACILQNTDKNEAIDYGTLLIKEVEESTQFIEKISISAAIVSFSEMAYSHIQEGRFYSSMMKIGKERLKLLDKLGPGSICSNSKITLRRSSGTVLLIESNRFEANLFERILEREGFETYSVTNGNEAIESADIHRPDVIVSEIFIAQMDGYQIRQKLLSSHDLKNVPFILVSREKNEDTIIRAHNLGIKYFLKKPVIAKEISGIIKLLIQESTGEYK